MSGISCASLEPPLDFSNGDSLDDTLAQQSDSGDTNEQTCEAGSELPKADEISDNKICETNQKVDLNLCSIERIVEETSGLSVSHEVETVAKRSELCFAESDNDITKADDSLPIVQQGKESCLPDPGLLLRCPYLDEVSDCSSRYIIEIPNFLCTEA